MHPRGEHVCAWPSEVRSSSVGPGTRHVRAPDPAGQGLGDQKPGCLRDHRRPPRHDAGAGLTRCENLPARQHTTIALGRHQMACRYRASRCSGTGGTGQIPIVISLTPLPPIGLERSFEMACAGCAKRKKSSKSSLVPLQKGCAKPVPEQAHPVPPVRYACSSPPPPSMTRAALPVLRCSLASATRASRC